MSRRAATVAQQVLSDGSGCSCCVRELRCLLCRTFPNLPFFHGSSFQVLPFSALNYVSCLNESAATHCCLFLSQQHVMRRRALTAAVSAHELQ